mgnify:CR=1 FL=1
MIKLIGFLFTDNDSKTEGIPKIAIHVPSLNNCIREVTTQKVLEFVIIVEHFLMGTCMGSNGTANLIPFFHVAKVHLTSYVIR